MPEATKVKEARHGGTHKEIEAKKAAKKAAKTAKAEAAAPAAVEKAARSSWQERKRGAEAAPAVVEKAVRKAVAKHYSQLKKANHPKTQLKARADSLILTVHSQLWRPR